MRKILKHVELLKVIKNVKYFFCLYPLRKRDDVQLRSHRCVRPLSVISGRLVDTCWGIWGNHSWTAAYRCLWFVHVVFQKLFLKLPFAFPVKCSFQELEQELSNSCATVIGIPRIPITVAPTKHFLIGVCPLIYYCYNMRNQAIQNQF